LDATTGGRRRDWSGPSNRRGTEIGDLFTDLWTRTNTTLSGEGYSVNYADFWQYGTSIQNRSSGYTNVLAQLTNYTAALHNRGILSQLNETALSAISGLSPQAVIESVLKPDDAEGNAARVANLVQYHVERSMLRLADIKSWYAEQANQQISLTGYESGATDTYDLKKYASGDNYIWSATVFPFVEALNDGVAISSGDYSIDPTAGTLTSSAVTGVLTVVLRTDWDGTAIGIPSSDLASTFLVERWAKTFTPTALIFADGDNISTDTAESVAILANSIWDDNGVAVHCFGLGRSHGAGILRTIADSTGGQHFDITNGTNGQDCIKWSSHCTCRYVNQR
jgi:hypothetical protein